MHELPSSVHPKSVGKEVQLTGCSRTSQPRDQWEKMHFKHERAKHLVGWVCISARGQGIHLDVLQTHHGKGPAVLWQLLSSRESGFYDSKGPSRCSCLGSALPCAMGRVLHREETHFNNSCCSLKGQKPRCCPSSAGDDEIPGTQQFPNAGCGLLW